MSEKPEILREIDAAMRKVYREAGQALPDGRSISDTAFANATAMAVYDARNGKTLEDKLRDLDEFFSRPENRDQEYLHSIMRAHTFNSDPDYQEWRRNRRLRNMLAFMALIILVVLLVIFSR